MDDIRRRIATIVERHLDEMIDQIMVIFSAEIPSVANADEGGQRRVRGSVRHALLAFLGVYADPASPARVLLEEARRVTMDRAGEEFDRGDIVAMLRIARHVVFGMTRAFVTRELEVAEEDEADVDAALEAFLSELERPEHRVAQAEEAVTHLLQMAEAEGSDVL